MVAGENPRPPALNDNPVVVILIDSQLSWNVLLLLCIVSKLHSWFVILPGNNEDEMNV